MCDLHTSMVMNNNRHPACAQLPYCVTFIRPAHLPAGTSIQQSGSAIEMERAGFRKARPFIFSNNLTRTKHRLLGCLARSHLSGTGDGPVLLYSHEDVQHVFVQDCDNLLGLLQSGPP